MLFHVDCGGRNIRSFSLGISDLRCGSSNSAAGPFNSPLEEMLMFKLVSLIGVLVLPGPLSAQLEPHAGQWKTWVSASGSAVRLPAPPDAAGSRRHCGRDAIGQGMRRGQNNATKMSV